MDLKQWFKNTVVHTFFSNEHTKTQLIEFNNIMPKKSIVNVILNEESHG